MKKQIDTISFYAICFVFLLIQQAAFGQYEGGEGNGFYEAESTNSDCSLINIYSGTYSDGFDFLKSIQECESRLFSVGGSGSGFSMDTILNNCFLPSIYKGNSSDGYAYAYNSSCPLDTVFIETDIIRDFSCSSTDSAIIYVHVIDVDPMLQSSPDFTYIWKNDQGDTLTGYPLIKSSYYDTLNNIGPGEYTVIVIDAQGKSDTAIVFIADCLYRGGSGVGFSIDTLNTICAVSSIYRNSGNDGAAALYDTGTCSLNFFSSGGSGSGFNNDSINGNCTFPNIFSGDASDGYGYYSITNNCVSNLYSVGGSGNGFDKDSLEQDCDVLSIYKGTQGDGFDYDTSFNVCFNTLFTTGGSGSGFDIDTVLNNCNLISIYTNSGNDGATLVQDLQDCSWTLFSQGGEGNGFDVDSSQQNCDLPNIFSGGTGDGHSIVYDIPCLKDSMVINADVLDQITCPLSTDDGSAYVSIVEGFPDWRSVAEYTYVWKNSAGDTLSGYPKTTSDISDTIYNLGVDDYTIIVTDAMSNTDSAIIYITDCLYRGGEGVGFHTDSVLSECLLTSVYTSSGYDGFDYAIDTLGCNFTLFSSGGIGYGFALDTVTSDCDLINVYKGTEGDGFDYKADIQTCNSTYFSTGGSGDGFAVDSIMQICGIPVITKGGDSDGADQQYNGCTPIIYENTATNNSCLIADTITSDGSNEWQLIEKDGMVVAAIKDYGNDLGEVTTQFYINDGGVRIDPFGILPSYYMDRNFSITTENLIYNSTVRVRLYFLTNELQALIDADDDVTSINSIGVTHYHGINENCTLFDNVDNNDNNNYLHTSTYDWDTYENGYYVEFDINSFSEFYINNSSSLPEPYSIMADISVLSDYNGSDVSCYGASDGIAVITPTYGSEPFTYLWDDPLAQTDSIATGLSAGTYHVIVVDNNNVTYTDSITISNPDSISIQALVTDACFGEDNGIIDLSVSGGTVASDYSYSWTTSDGSGIVAGEEDQYSLTIGTYTVTVKDDNMCAKDTSIVVLEHASSEVPTSVTVLNNNTCEGTSKILIPVGGVLGYNAEWSWYSDAALSNLIYSGDSCEVDPGTSTSYWVRAEGNCDSSSVISVDVTVVESSSAADSISKSDDYVVAGTEVTLVVCGGTLGDGASWNWYLDAAGTISAGVDNDTLIVSPTVTTQYWARAEGTCNSTAMVTTIVTISPLPHKPGKPVGADTLCQNAPDTYYYTAGASGATSYTWNISPSSAGTISGTGTTGIVDWSASYYEDVSIIVTGENSAGSGPVSDTLKVWIWKQPTIRGIYHISNKYAE